jgi:hypothetical protein
MFGHGYRYLTADEQVIEHPLILHGIVLLTSVTGGDVTLYDGLGTAGSSLIGRFEGIADQSTPIELFGLHLERGLYVDIGSNVTSVLVIYDPIKLP